MTARHSDHRAIDGVLAEAPLADAIGPVCELPREIKLRAVSCVLRRVPDCDQADVLQMLLAPPRRDGQTTHMRSVANNAAYKAKGGAPKPKRADEQARYPMPLGESKAARDYRYEVRQWGRAAGRVVYRNGSLQPALLNAYVEATGHLYEAAA